MLHVEWVPLAHCCSGWFCKYWITFMEGND